MGTPDFAVTPLKLLAEKGKEQGIEIGLAVSQPDRQRDRGKKIKYTPVKETALHYGIRVIQPEKIRGNTDFLRELKAYAPDLIIVAAYGKILPEEIINLPPLGCVNIHGSLLPRWRGAAPIQRCLMEGDEKTGVTLMHMSLAMDEGDIIAQREIFTAKKTAGELFNELSLLGGEILMDSLGEILSGSRNRVPQEHNKATYAPMLSKSEGELDFSMDSYTLECRIRGLSPWPGAFTYMKKRVLKIWEAEVVEGKVSAELLPGTVIGVDKKGIDVKTGKGILRIKKLQMPGKKAMDVKSFLLGRSMDPGTVLGE